MVNVTIEVVRLGTAAIVLLVVLLLSLPVFSGDRAEHDTAASDSDGELTVV